MIVSEKHKEIDGAVVIISCDKYQPFWEGFCFYMQKHWDLNISWPIYFFTNNLKLDFKHPNWHNICLGDASFYDLQNRALRYLERYEYVFCMLEDFWPCRPMTSNMFLGLFDLFVKHDWDCLHIDSMRPEYYKVMATEITFGNQKILQFSKDSDWFFNQQAGFWKRKLLLDCAVQPEISENLVSTTLSFEQACDSNLKKHFSDSKIMLYHYWWYPRAGVSWRGQFSLIGKEMEAHMYVDKWCENQFDLFMNKKSPSVG